MAASQKHLQREQIPVAAILLNLETDGFTCRKWGGEQTCKPGDWIVDNAGSVYTLDCDSFARTDRADSPDLYRKVAPNWADLAPHDAAIKTKEGAYPVFKDEQRQDGYAVTVPVFEIMYEPAR